MFNFIRSSFESIERSVWYACYQKFITKHYIFLLWTQRNVYLFIYTFAGCIYIKLIYNNSQAYRVRTSFSMWDNSLWRPYPGVWQFIYDIGCVPFPHCAMLIDVDINRSAFYIWTCVCCEQHQMQCGRPQMHTFRQMFSHLQSSSSSSL